MDYDRCMDVVAIVSIVGLVLVLIVKDLIGYRERVDTQRLNKAKSLSEVEVLFDKPEDDEEEDEGRYTSLEDIPVGVVPEGPISEGA